MPELLLEMELDEPGVEQLAARLAPCVRHGDCLLLHGTLGAGKTAFTRALVQALSPHPQEVSSPTFTLLQSYPVALQHQAAEFWHADLYRLEDASALEEIGLHELPPRGILCVEWPEIAQDWLPKHALTLRFSHTDAAHLRRVQLGAPVASEWPVRLAALL